MCNEDPYQQVDTTDLIDITWGDAARSQIGEVSNLEELLVQYFRQETTLETRLRQLAEQVDVVDGDAAASLDIVHPPVLVKYTGSEEVR